MNKEEILREIRRCAEANGGVPLGEDRFQAETGIGLSDWKKYWARWGDALREAGYVANRFGREAYADGQLLEKYAHYARQLGRLPTSDDIPVNRRKDSTFPGAETFSRRWRKSVLVEKLLEYCRSHREYGDAVGMCEDYLSQNRDVSHESAEAGEQIGSVYLMKSGRYYKTGNTSAVGRREYELGIQLPEEINIIHVIPTDDPSGIEAYWHKRFEAKRQKGEWFKLDAADVAAFKRRKFI
jgi:hypothetical protein